MMICFLLFCLFTPAAPVVPHGQGGFVPFTNARVLPDGSMRPYDPAIDGVMGPDGRVYFPYLPYPADPPGRVTVGPPRVMPAPANPAPGQCRKAAEGRGRCLLWP